MDRKTPKLVYEDRKINYSDGRVLVYFDPSTDTEEELMSIVEAVNNYDRLLAENNALREDLKWTKHNLEENKMLVSHYTELKAKMDKLSAENKRMRQALERIYREAPERLYARYMAKSALEGEKIGGDKK